MESNKKHWKVTTVAIVITLIVAAKDGHILYFGVPTARTDHEIGWPR